MTTYAERQREYLDLLAALPGPPPTEPGEVANLIPSDAFLLLPRLETGYGAFDTALLDAGLAVIAARRDCADFALAGLLRLLYRYADSARLPDSAREAIRAAALGFCYWYDQRAGDGRGIRGMCFHTENHQILFHGCELLAGQLFPNTVFAGTGQTGAWHAAHGGSWARRWMDQRARFGFAEWLSSYFEEDLLALLNLFDFAGDAAIRRNAGMLVDLILFEIAQHSLDGAAGTTHGRTYAEFLTGRRPDPNAGIAWLAFGVGERPERPNLALIALATSSYTPPPLLEAMARDQPAAALIRERHGVDVADAARYGLSADHLEDAPFFWACQTARHPRLRPTAREVARIADDPWLAAFVEAADERLPACQALIEEAGGVFDGDALNTALAAVNLVTYRTPGYLLSCAQDFRPGRPGYQQHVWQATLPGGAVVFTTHPGSRGEGGDHVERPNFWAGCRWLPRAAQHHNVLICLHHVPADDPLPFSHAFFPRARFDTVTQVGPWTFGRKGDAYVALYSQHPAHWAGDDELRAAEGARDNVWICEMGDRAAWGDFARFVAAITAAPVRCGDDSSLRVLYDSPSRGAIDFGWAGPLCADGAEIPLAEYPRLDSPYGHAALGDRIYTISCKGESLTWDFR